MTYAVVPDIEHGYYFLGTTDLRLLWNNLLIIAGDDTSGYGQDGYDVAGGFPHGYALCFYRNRATITGFREGAAGQKTRIYLRRVLNYLRYRAFDAELVYTDTNSETVRKKLENCDRDIGDTYEYRILDLDEISDLTYGQEYFLEVIDSGSGDYPTDEDMTPILDFAEEIF
jgi:hypothetical protein